MDWKEEMIKLENYQKLLKYCNKFELRNSSFSDLLCVAEIQLKF
jgi:hypothetical protein